MGAIRTYAGGVAFITGGASGIGRAIGEELARRGAEVVLLDLQADLCESVAADIRKAGGKATARRLDVRDFASVEAATLETYERLGRIDYVFNNAGTGVFGETHLFEESDWDLLIDVNVRGAANVVRATYPRMIEQGFGHLVNTASMAGLVPAPLLAVYAATKHAMVGLSKSMRAEAAIRGVRVSALCPGAIRTPILTGGLYGRCLYEMSEARMLSWWEKLRPMDVGPFAKQAVDAVAKNESVIVLPRRNMTLVRMFRLFPSLEEKLSRKTFEATLRHFPEVAKGKPKAAKPAGVALDAN